MKNNISSASYFPISSDSHDISPLMQHLMQETNYFLQNALSPATQKAYATDWRCFEDFCKQHGFNSLDATYQQIMLFVTEQAGCGKAPQTLQRRLAAIKFMYELSGLPSPIDHKMIRVLMQGIRRQRPLNKQAGKKPLRLEMLHQILALCDTNTLKGLRDYALLLFGFSGAFRRSEICTLHVDDLTETVDGLKIFIRKSKTDQEGKGTLIAIPHGQNFPIIQALKQWLQAAHIHQGYVFRAIRKGGKTVGNSLDPLAVSTILKEYLVKIGENPDDYGAHSLRSGFLTEAAEHGASLFKMLEVSRHRSTDTILHYIKTVDIFKNHAGKDFL